MTSFFANVTGSLDQIGGTIDLPAKFNYIPFVQGISTSIPIGLDVSQRRKFVWSLEEDYPGVSLNNVNNTEVNLLFDLSKYREFGIKLRVTVKGQPRNFAIFDISTTIQSILTNQNLASVSSITNNRQYQINDLSIGLDHSYINEAGTPVEVNSGLLFSWNRPNITQNFEDYLLEEYIPGQGWTEWNVQTKRTKPVINTNNSYRIQARYNNYQKGRAVYFPLRNNSQVYGKSQVRIISSTTHSNTLINIAEDTRGFFTFVDQLNYEDSYSTLENRGATKDNTTINLIQYPESFWSSKASQDYDDNINNNSLGAINTSTNITTPPYTEIFWSTAIGV